LPLRVRAPTGLDLADVRVVRPARAVQVDEGAAHAAPRPRGHLDRPQVLDRETSHDGDALVALVLLVGVDELHDLGCRADFCGHTSLLDAASFAGTLSTASVPLGTGTGKPALARTAATGYDRGARAQLGQKE